MPSVKEQRAEAHSRLTWLMSSWSRKERKIRKLQGRAHGMGPVEGMKPSFFQKFMGLLQQISGLREKELVIISEINAVEKKHRALRKSKKLKRAAPKPASWQYDPNAEDEDEDAKEERSGINFWFVAIFLWLMSENNSNKNQGPKND
jgi:hypothetical protein